MVRSHKQLFALHSATWFLLSLVFAPIQWWPVTFVCLVPWAVAVATTDRAPRVYAHSYLMGLLFFLVNMRWMYFATGAGYIVLSAYLAFYFPLMACPLRHAARRRRWPMALAIPLVWTGAEMVQAVAFSGFPWFFLSHGLSRVLPMIQISDFTGAYGTSFVAAAVSGAISDVVLARLGRCRRGVAASAKESVGGEDADHSRTNRGSASYSGRPRFGIAFAGALLMLTLGYGFFRLSENTIHEGPRVGIVQGDFLMSVSGEETPDVVKRRIYMHMLRAAAKESPDILALPESPWRMLLNPEARRLSSFSWKSFRELQEIATQSGAYLVTGSATLIRTPMDLLAKIHWYNSATLFRPDASEPGRYDKVHVVPFGEAVPFRFGRLRSLYLWLHQLMPFSGANGEAEYSVFPGESFHTFEVRPASQPDRTYQIGIPICYEDVMPYVSRIFVRGEGGRRRADLLLNISNDGWFGRGHQQPQHLAASVFRAVENRVGIARAVNTGVSALIEPTGRVHDVVRRDDSNPWPRACGYAVARVGVDSRRSTYTVYGDWFGWSCAILWLVVYLDYWILRVRSPDDRG